MALYNFRKIDITTQEGKRKIIDTFINSIYLYDDHLKIIYNANSKEETVSLAELESSTLFSRGAPPADTHLVTLRIRIGVCFYVIDICMQFRYNILENQYSGVPHMKLREIIQYIDAVSIPDKATVTQLRREEDDEPYQVWKIDTNSASYILKEAKESEAETYQYILSGLEENSVPVLYQTISADGKTFLLMEYIDGENLRNCNRTKLTFALDSLISLQRKTWENRTLENYGYSFEKSLFKRQNRQKNLHDPLLEKAYENFWNCTVRFQEHFAMTICFLQHHRFA